MEYFWVALDLSEQVRARGLAFLRLLDARVVSGGRDDEVTWLDEAF